MLKLIVFTVLLPFPYIGAFGQDGTPDQRERLLNDSAWSLRVEATMDDPADVRETSSNPLPEAAQAGLQSKPSNSRWDGEIGKNRMGHLATIPVLVRWDSAAVIRRALEGQHEGDTTALATDAQTNFIITVQGLLPGRQAKSRAALTSKSSSDEGDTAKSSEDTLEWFMANSRLFVKGQPAIQPQNVKVDQDSGAVHVFFNRTDAVGARKRDVVFVTRFGTMNVQARFRTKDMVVDGKPDL